MRTSTNKNFIVHRVYGVVCRDTVIMYGSKVFQNPDALEWMLRIPCNAGDALFAVVYEYKKSDMVGDSIVLLSYYKNIVDILLGLDIYI